MGALTGGRNGRDRAGGRVKIAQAMRVSFRGGTSLPTPTASILGLKTDRPASADPLACLRRVPRGPQRFRHIMEREEFGSDTLRYGTNSSRRPHRLWRARGQITRRGTSRANGRSDGRLLRALIALPQAGRSSFFPGQATSGFAATGPRRLNK